MGGNDFLLRGPENAPPVFSMIGIRFVSIAGSIEFIGEVTQVVDSILVVREPVIVGRDTRNVNKFNLIKLSGANPIVSDTLHVPISSIAFMCVPTLQFTKNYLAARSGLVSPTQPFDESRPPM